MANPFEDLGTPESAPARNRSTPAPSGNGKPRPHKARLILVIAIVSLAVLPFTLVLGFLNVAIMPLIAAPIAWLMAHTDLKDMRAGRVDPAGRAQTEIARRVAIGSTIFWVACLVLWIGYRVIGGGVAFGSRPITHAEFDRVQHGMTQKQVTDLVGPPARTDYHRGVLNWYWLEKGGRDIFTLDFDERGLVSGRGWDTPD